MALSKKGVFVSYQMAEAIKMLSDYDIANPSERKAAEQQLDMLKARWSKDIIPGYGVEIGDNIAGMKDLSIDEVAQFAEDIQSYDTYSTENAGNMQYCLKRDEDGNIDFDFSYLNQIAELARRNNKKLIIDSAVVFGDRFPENIANMSKEEIENAITLYTRKLTTDFGDCIDRIDVLNSVFQRDNVYNRQQTLNSEEFWINVFGKDYGSKVLSIVRDSSQNTNINLCWNEFYITNERTPRKLEAFMHAIESTPEVDVVGLQDAFRADTSCEYIQSTLEKMANLCKKLGKKMSITELSCTLGKDDIESLNSVKQSEEYADRVEEINRKIAEVLKTVTDVAEKNSDVISSVEARYSDRYDFNHEQLKHHYGHDIQTSIRRDNNFGHESKTMQLTNGVIDSLQGQVVIDDKEYAQNIASLEKKIPVQQVKRKEI